MVFADASAHLASNRAWGLLPLKIFGNIALSGIWILSSTITGCLPWMFISKDNNFTCSVNFECELHQEHYCFWRLCGSLFTKFWVCLRPIRTNSSLFFVNCPRVNHLAFLWSRWWWWWYRFFYLFSFWITLVLHKKVKPLKVLCPASSNSMDFIVLEDWLPFISHQLSHDYLLST